MILIVITMQFGGGLIPTYAVVHALLGETIFTQFVPGAIVKISADMTGWYESGRTTDIVIRRNKLSRRNCHKWGKALFDIDPEMTKQEENRYFHQNILIEENEITLNSLPFAYGQGVKNLVISNNTFLCDNPEQGDENLRFEMKHCGNIEIQGNTYKKKEDAR